MICDIELTRLAVRPCQSGSLGQLAAQDIAGEDPAPLLGERNRDGSPESMRRAGDDGNLAGKIDIHAVAPRSAIASSSSSQARSSWRRPSSISWMRSTT